jgi:hypothetical protein
MTFLNIALPGLASLILLHHALRRGMRPKAVRIRARRR